MGFCASSLVAAMVPTRADRLNFGNEGVYPPFSMADSTKPQIGVEPDLARANAALPSMMADCAPTQIRKECIAFSLQPADAACADKQA